MIYQRECLASVKEDIKPLLEKHWEEVALHQGQIKLEMKESWLVIASFW
jgi:hypothetical protein